MFRRKEDSLFDTATDPNQPRSASAMESATINPPPSASASEKSSTSSSSSSPASSSASSQPARSASESSSSRPAAPASNAGFRPAAAPLGDMGRNRMPEPKGPISVPSADKGGKNSGRRVLTVGNDILLKGEIATCDRLVIEGKVDATLNEVHTVEIAETGSFKGAANIEDAEISGLFEGELSVRGRLVIYSTGKVRGKITYGEIEIERGGELSGEIKNAGTQSGAATRKEKDKFAA